MKTHFVKIPAYLLILAFLTSLITCKPTPSPQFPFTVLPKKGESFRKPFQQPRGKKILIQSLKISRISISEFYWIRDALKFYGNLLFKPSYPAYYYNGYDSGYNGYIPGGYSKYYVYK